MPHVYATLDEFKKYLVDVAADFGSVADTDLLLALESASRTVDGHCKRTDPDHPMSGFGPRLGVNRYDGTGGELDLEDDLLTITSVTVAGATIVDDTAFLKVPFDRAPYRTLIPATVGATPFYTLTRRAISVTAKWGYQDVRVPSTTTVSSGLTTTTTQTTFVSSATPTLVPGQTILIDSEQLYVSGVSGTTITVVRAANGTTAAVHADASAISVYQYPSNVTRCTLVIAGRRRKQRDAGLTGNFGGAPGMPTTLDPERSERWVLDDYLSDYKFALVA